jgi:hypothetical protein
MYVGPTVIIQCTGCWLDDRSLTAYEVSTVKGSDLASRHNPELMQAMWGPSLDPYEMV